MTEKLTYEELEQRVKELEKEDFKRTQAEEALKESEEQFVLFMDYLPAIVFIKDEESNTLYVNKYMNDVLGAKSWIGKTPLELFPKDIGKAMIADDKKTISKGYQEVVETVPDMNGIMHIYQTHKFRIDRHDKPPMVGGIALDITERKKAEEALKQAHDELESRVAERTRELKLQKKSLEELNTAMKILLKKREEDKIEVEQNVMTNVRELISPYFDKINATKLNDHQEAFLNILESNLNEIISPFTRKLSLKYLNLTPKEIQIVNMIKIGYQSKKIARIMKISPRTVDTHRKNIRSKIGLGQKRANLRSHILAHEQ